ncbi:MAG: outer membrane beta-barrel protein [Bacteroidales bacterium]|nr:outer membrane beta-barrel protein [Bacteroidales bacterium]MBP8643537.1 outer membrane beta-barrel protein [Bacteroidales bacterium]HOW21234.1 outer membrane beta-barrel protein [Tenuifilaceae bacterium]HRC94134.1 outer membrane beta-barrel protein [Tenuifilaceae bacterium]
MKKIFVVIAVIWCSVTAAQAQYRKPNILNDPDYDVGKPLRFGFSIGINIMDFDIKNSSVPELNADSSQFQYFTEVTHINPGLNVNAISDLRLAENFHLRFLPGYSFGQRNLDFFKVENGRVTHETTMDIESNFIDLPLGIKYLAERTSNIRPYLYVGGDYRIDLAAYKRLKVEKGILVRLQKQDFYYEFGFGVDFFFEYFKFSTEVKWSAGIGNVISSDYAEGAENYRYAVDAMNSRLIMISFHFE